MNLYPECQYMVSEPIRAKIINRLVKEYINISTEFNYYSKNNEDKLRQKLEKCTGIYEMAYEYQPFSHQCPMTKIIDTLIIKYCLI